MRSDRLHSALGHNLMLVEWHIHTILPIPRLKSDLSTSGHYSVWKWGRSQLSEAYVESLLQKLKALCLVEDVL